MNMVSELKSKFVHLRIFSFQIMKLKETSKQDTLKVDILTLWHVKVH